MTKYILILFAAFALSFSGCVNPTQPSGTVGGGGIVVTSKDPVVIAEITTQIAYDTFDTLFTLEYQNRALLLAKAPAVKVAIDSLRLRAPQLLASARTMTKVYEANATPENLLNLQAILATVNQAVVESQRYAVQVHALR